MINLSCSITNTNRYTPQNYNATDLDAFNSRWSASGGGTPIPQGVRPTLVSIDGGFLDSTASKGGGVGFDYQGESNLDIQYGNALVYPQGITLYQTGDSVEGASFSDFLDAFDATFCADDDPSQDAVYPDPYGTVAEGAYKGAKNCGTLTPAKVISTSYGYNEADLTYLYEMRQCNEYLKFGLLGTTFVYSSGDYGVAGNSGECILPNGTYTAPDATTGRFNPSFPGTCPYITSIGATQVIPGSNIITDKLTGTQPEQASETVIYSGGGFSNNFPMPSYQVSIIHSFAVTLF